MNQVDIIKEIDILIEHVDTLRKTAEKLGKFNNSIKYGDQINILELLKTRIEGVTYE